MFARVARYQIPEENLDDAVEGFREAIEQLRGLQGNSGGYLLVDRDNSTALTVTFWENRAALESSDMAGKQAAIGGGDPARGRDPGGRPLRGRDRLLRALQSVRPQKKDRPGRICGQSAGADPVFGAAPVGLNPFEG